MSNKSESPAEDYSSSDSENNEEVANQKQEELLTNIKSILKTGDSKKEGKNKKKGVKLVRKEVKLIGMFIGI